MCASGEDLSCVIPRLLFLMAGHSIVIVHHSHQSSIDQTSTSFLSPSLTSTLSKTSTVRLQGTPNFPELIRHIHNAPIPSPPSSTTLTFSNNSLTALSVFPSISTGPSLRLPYRALVKRHAIQCFPADALVSQGGIKRQVPVGIGLDDGSCVRMQ